MVLEDHPVYHSKRRNHTLINLLRSEQVNETICFLDGNTSCCFVYVTSWNKAMKYDVGNMFSTFSFAKLFFVAWFFSFVLCSLEKHSNKFWFFSSFGFGSFLLFFCDILMIDGYFVFKMGNELIPEKNLVEEVWRIYTKFFLPVIPEFCSTKTIPGRNVQGQNQSKKVFCTSITS